MKIQIEPRQITEEIANKLEKIGVISRICPGHDPVSAERGMSSFKTVYSTNECFGPHKLISVKINTVEPKNFLYHSDKEDFMLIDHPESSPLILLMALIKKDELNEKIQKNCLSEDDFIAIICEKNHPYFSFFTMNPHFAHVETCLEVSDFPPSFYVTEPRDMDENLIDMGDYVLEIVKP